MLYVISKRVLCIKNRRQSSACNNSNFAFDVLPMFKTFAFGWYLGLLRSNLKGFHYTIIALTTIVHTFRWKTRQSEKTSALRTSEAALTEWEKRTSCGWLGRALCPRPSSRLTDESQPLSEIAPLSEGKSCWRWFHYSDHWPISFIRNPPWTLNLVSVNTEAISTTRCVVT